MSKLIKSDYNPDILETIANLSNDEVFTPPDLARDMLDMLPEEIWSDSTITFLDPAVKTGIFLREITSRLIDGLADEIPDLQERVNHILTNQVYGLGITELTTLMSRRTVYCSTTANGKYSVCTEFDDDKGNILFPDTKHTFDDNGRCEYCGANRDNYDGKDGSENYAYPFIHDNFEEVFDGMKFDVIIGNPPYQLSDGGASASAMPIYQYFIEAALSLNPKYITMITPSRWLVGGKGLDGFRAEMIERKKFTKIINYELAKDCFPSVGIAGGVNYFLIDNHSKEDNILEVKNIYSNGEVNSSKRLLDEHAKKNLFILNNRVNSIIGKIQKDPDFKRSFDEIVSVRDPYRIDINLAHEEEKENSIPLYNHKLKAFISKNDVLESRTTIKKDKIFISFAYGNSSDRPNQVINKPFIPEANAVCGGTYLLIGPFNSSDEAKNVLSYMKTKFFRLLILAVKPTQHGTRKVYQFVPMQDFSKSWTDEELYKNYDLTKDEIEYIESTIKDMS